MLGKRSTRTFLVGTLALLMVSAVWARGNAPTQARSLSALQGEAVRVDVVTGAIREGATVTYSITLLNGSAADVTDIFIAGAVPLRASFVGATAMPSKTGFRGVEDGNAVFLAERLPALGSLGPFSYQVTLGSEAPGPAWAWVHWRLPGDGTAVSSRVAAPGTGQFPGVDGTPLTGGHFPKLPEGQWAIAVLEAFLPPGTVFDTGEVPPFLFYQSEGWMSTQFRDGTRKSTGPGSSFFDTRPHVHTVAGDRPVRGVIFLLVRAGAEVSSRPGISVVGVSPKLEGLISDVPYLFTLSFNKFHPPQAGSPHAHIGANVRYLLEGSVIDYPDGLARGPGSVLFEQADVRHELTVTGGQVARGLVVTLRPSGTVAAVPAP